MQKDTHAVVQFRVIKGGLDKTAVFNHAKPTEDLPMRMGDLIQALDIAAHWLALPPARRESIKEAVTMETKQALYGGEKSVMYAHEDNPYTEMYFHKRHTLLNHRGRVAVACKIIEEERRSGVEQGGWCVERWIDKLLINERYPYHK